MGELAQAVVGPTSAEPTAVATSVIFMVPDGFGAVEDTAYRVFKGADPVWQDGLKALVRTGSASSPTTDSAAAATAFATGVKTSNGAVSVDVDGNPLVSVLDLASDAGKATGIVSTAAITDATPAAFAASTGDRDDRADIAQQYIDKGNLDVILGGGHEDFAVDADGDGTTTLEEAQAAGFFTVSTREELLAAPGDRLLGLFAEGEFGPPIGNGKIGLRPDGAPTLAEMTEAALSRLSADADGFFLLVEEEGTDTWGHSNDAAAVMNAAKSYEDALQVARAYAEANPGTLVISVADHETGGMSLPLAEGSTPEVFRSFDATHADTLAAVEEAVAALGPEADPDLVLATVNAIVSDATGGAVALTAEEVVAVLDAETSRESREAFSAALNAHGGVEYATTGHTAADVPLYAFGAGADLHSGSIDNTSVADWVAEALGLALPKDGSRIISGTGADDLLIGTENDDSIAGGSGNDVLIGRDGNDRLDGGAGNDRLRGREGDDTLVGGEGDDSLRGGADDDVLQGGLGSDVFIFGRDTGSDRITDFAPDADQLRFQAGVVADLDALLAASEQQGDDLLVFLGKEIEIRLDGTTLDDLLHADLVFA